MPKYRTTRVKPEVLESDLKAVTTLQQLSGYAPLNQEYSIEALEALCSVLEEAVKREHNIRNAARAAYDSKVEIEWAIHEGVLGAKDQVRAQYGPSSDAVQALGLKKKSKYRRTKSRVLKSA